MPHRQNVEAAAEFEALRLGGELQPELDQIGEALIAFTLKVMLGCPQGIIAQLVHQPRDIAGRPENFAEALVLVATVVRRGAVQADMVEFDLADVEGMRALDHIVT
jgi:hypothetical protein